MFIITGHDLKNTKNTERNNKSGTNRTVYGFNLVKISIQKLDFSGVHMLILTYPMLILNDNGLN